MRASALLFVCLLASAACGTSDVDVEPVGAAEVAASSTSTSTSTTAAPSTTSTTIAPSTSTTTTTTTTTIAAGAVYFEQDYAPMTTAGPVTLTHPATRVELIGFHQAGHDGSQAQSLLPSAAPSTVLEDRGRNTSLVGAADVVVDPAAEIRSPVTGTVIRAGGYVLYCDHEDHFIVIEPDEAPGWEVKIFHMETITVGVGDRVEAGVTRISPNGRVLPFVSQVDAFTAEPSNPHVHIEVIDPSIPDIPSGTGGSC